jgi:hypothetical protein
MGSNPIGLTQYISYIYQYTVYILYKTSVNGYGLIGKLVSFQLIYVGSTPTNRKWRNIDINEVEYTLRIE